MDEKVMALSALDAAQKSAEWAYWSMWGTWVSAVATILAAGVAVWAIKGWKKHEEALELKEFRVMAYAYHVSLIRAPEKNSDNLNELEFLAVQNTYNSLDNFYLSVIKMHSKITRGKASLVYQRLANIHEDYIHGHKTSDEAQRAVLQIRQQEPLLGIGLKN
ncbi:hypothetical protein NMCA_23300 [Enterobacter ludwigii]|jgi:hypothetical protein|uniref:hypothetical protein n=1 Tax=Enterobacter ludwigii TaxID=299767 RepID=UPI00124DF31B|nr:hypothetical protein [Enterobacter ludwigii]GER63392.1 hypothetical protein NMCA_23300 [Enterobacter ludwigii]